MVLILVAAVAGWLVLRETPAEPGPVPVSIDDVTSTPRPPGTELAAPGSAATESRAPTSIDSAPSPEPAAAKSASAFLVRGRVVDCRRFGVAGTEVRMVRGEGEPASVRSQEDGRFQFTIDERAESYQSVCLWAFGDDAAAVKSVTIPGSKPVPYRGYVVPTAPLGDVDAGMLVLSPAKAMRVSVVEAGRPAAGAQVQIELQLGAQRHWHGTTDVEGMTTSPPLPAGCIELAAVLGRLEGRARAFLPTESEVRIALAPGFEATVTVVDKSRGAPIPGATVELLEQLRVPSLPNDLMGMGGEYVSMRGSKERKLVTEADGIARFSELFAESDYRLRVRVPGFAGYPTRGSAGERFGATQPHLRIELDPTPARTVSWAITAGEVPLPSDGATITLRPAPGNSRDLDGDELPDRVGVVRLAQVFVDAFEGGGLYLGTAPDGSIATFWVDEKADIGRPVSFRWPRTIEVLVRDADAAPVVGARVLACNQGNNSLGEPVPTDAEGRAKLTGLQGGLCEVFVFGQGGGAREHHAGTVDIEKGDARLEVQLPALETMRVRLAVLIDGVAELPPEYRVSHGVIQEIPEEGELVLGLLLPAEGERITLSLTATGFLPASVQLPVVRDGSESRASLELVRGTTLTALVTRPGKDTVQIQLHTWKEPTQAWGPVPGRGNGLYTSNGPGGSFRFFTLPAGRYRVIDEKSQLASEPVEVLQGQVEAQVSLDLSGLEWVSGRVELPDRAELPRVRVLGTSTTSAFGTWLPGFELPKAGYVQPDGTFRVPVQHGVPTRLHAWHPWLAPAQPGGEIEVDAGREGVVLRLVEGASVRLAAPQLAQLRGFRSARVALYAGPVHGEPIAWMHAPLVEGVLRFTGIPEGRATLWIDPAREFAPLVLEDVAIGAGLTDLGVAEFRRGSSIRIPIQVKDGEAAPRIYVSARRESAPALLRDLNSGGEAEVVLSGLEAGVWTVLYRSMGSVLGGKGTPERKIELDGVEDVVIPLDLR